MKNFHFGDNLRMMRCYRGYSQEAMGNGLDMAQGTYSKIEYNKDLPETEMIGRLAEILKFSPDEFRSTDWYANQYNQFKRTSQTFTVLKRQGQIGYIVLLFVAWIDMCRGFIDGARIQTMEVKLLSACLIGIGVLLFHRFSVEQIKVSFRDEGDLNEGEVRD